MSRRNFRKILQKYFPQHLKAQVLNCPACGKDDQLWFPIESASCSGVGCYRCHLKITRYWPKFFPSSLPKNIKSADALDWMYLYSFFILLKTWNRLPRK